MEKIKKFLFVNTSTKQTVIKNTFWLFLSETLGRFLKLGLIVYAARTLGANGWGIFSYAISIGSLLMIFSDIGLSGLITREASQKKEGYMVFITTALALKIVVLIASIFLLIFVSPLISHIPEARGLFPIIALILFFDSLKELFFAINRANEKMEREMIVKTIMSIIILVSGIILLKIKLAPESMAIAYATGSIIGFLIIALIIKKDIKKLIAKIDITKLKIVIRATWPFAIIPLVGTIMANTDIYMLGIWRSSVEIGLYASVDRIQQFIIIIPSTIAIAVFPLLSRLVNNDNNKQRTILEKTISIILTIGLPMSLGGIVLANQIVPFIFGSEYSGAIPILRIFMLILLVSFPLILISNTILAYNKQKNLVRAFSFGVIANILLNILFIPKFGAAGSAISTLISTIITTYIIWKKLKKITYFEILPSLKKIILATLFMVILTILLKYIKLNLLINIIVSATVYLYLLFLLKEPILKEVKTIFKQS